MPHSRCKTDVSFDGPATYRIIVKGRIDDFWFENLGGMDISTQSHRDGPEVTILVGEMRDQAEFMGVMNSLYELHLPILSVESTTEIHGGRVRRIRRIRFKGSEVQGSRLKRDGQLE